ncbi:L,D-transpeptidase family protein [Laspinema olomoucense]|uniref:L,D-transpeptidase family protein n=1 Tax=Laspinema olomoucense TaxID=3231600 RepID=UPI0021BAA7D7|nr:L,D-transpeptidase family protein [Laspinema sp. D3c]
MFLRHISVLGALILALGNAPAHATLNELANSPRVPEPQRIDPHEIVYRTPTATQTHLILSLTDRRVYVYHNRVLQSSYPVAVGKPGSETPLGTFQVFQMVKDPVWESPFTGEVIPAGVPQNPLGPRWIAFWTDGNNAIGFHGTDSPESIGGAESWGCARMLDADAIALYDQVQIGTTVTVIP